MSPKDHCILGGVAAVALYPSFGFVNAAIFWLAAVFIDIDHYIDYVYRNRFTDFSPTNMIRFYNELDRFWRYPEFLAISVFHTAEFMVPLFIATLWSGSAALVAVFIGCVFHIALDVVFLGRRDLWFIRVYSIIEYFLRKRSLEERGYRPLAIFKASLKAMKGREEDGLYY